ncbi:MAG: hypothetical protein AAF514_00510 [Verrucomicrobiota bacterium]
MRKTYEERVERFENEIRSAEAASNRASNRRGLVFFAALIGVGVALYAPLPAGVAIGFAVFGGALFLVFGWLVLAHRGLLDRLDQARHIAGLNRAGLARLDRDWEGLPLPPTPGKHEDHPLGRDLDLFGPASLFHWINMASSPGGRSRLADWLVHPATREEIANRQVAVRELGPKIDWRQKLHFSGRLLEHTSSESIGMPFRESAEPVFSSRPGLMLAVRLLPWAFFILLALYFIGWVQPWWVILLLVMWVLNKVFARRIEAAIGDLRKEEKALEAYTSMFATLEELECSSPWLKERREQLEGAHRAVSLLCRYATGHAARGSLVYPVLKNAFLSDFHLAAGVERWQSRYGGRVECWFEAMAEIEAVASLANLHQEEPGWVFPETDEAPTLMAEALGHPLIQAGVRVGNDLTLDPPGRFLLVTGSNMSGKSTLLRSVGLNAVLAQAGAPVCARAFQMPPVHIVSSLRVEDSLSDGVSYFMAELHRIKSAVQVANDPPEGRVLLYLFDEILRGTNSGERQTIVERLLTHLLRCRAIGAITTHDLALAEVETLRSAARAVHFRESFVEDPEGPKMVFDYRLRDGLATTRNAVKLLEMMDLDL